MMLIFRHISILGIITLTSYFLSLSKSLCILPPRDFINQSEPARGDASAGSCIYDVYRFCLVRDVGIDFCFKYHRPVFLSVPSIEYELTNRLRVPIADLLQHFAGIIIAPEPPPGSPDPHTKPKYIACFLPETQKNSCSSIAKSRRSGQRI